MFMEILDGVVKYVPLIFDAVGFVVDRLNNNSNKKDEVLGLKEEMQNQIKELNEQRRQNEDLIQDYAGRIRQLEQSLRESASEMKRRELEIERMWIEKEQKERERANEELRLREENLKKCKESLNEELAKGLFDVIRKFSAEEKKWFKSLSEKELEEKVGYLKQELRFLFDKLFDSEKVQSKILRKFISVMNYFIVMKKLERMNFVIIGTSGIGKSTLINELLFEMLAKEKGYTLED